MYEMKCTPTIQSLNVNFKACILLIPPRGKGRGERGIKGFEDGEGNLREENRKKTFDSCKT